jgi:pimeloyl-ACP methyl ester carboxylesterase
MCSAPEAVLRFLPERVGEMDARVVLPKIACPVLLVGSAAPRFDPAQARSILPGLRYEQIPGAGHFLQVYAAQEVVRLVRDFVG